MEDYINPDNFNNANSIVQFSDTPLVADDKLFDPAIAAQYGNPNESVLQFMGVPLYETEGLINLVIRFTLNFLIAWLLCYFAYYRKSHRRDWYRTFLLFSSTMFLLIFLMENVKLQIGFTLGLFAIFGMIRYRTETVPIREMTYLFVIIGLSVVNGLAMAVSYAELLLANALLLTIAFVLEHTCNRHNLTTKIILYDRIENIVPEKREELLQDLRQRTGLDIQKIEIGHVDFLRDAAYIKISYPLPKNEQNTIGTSIKPS